MQLTELLDSELRAEQSIYSEQHGSKPLEIAGWAFAHDRAEVKLSKQHHGEK